MSTTPPQEHRRLDHFHRVRRRDLTTDELAASTARPSTDTGAEFSVAITTYWHCEGEINERVKKTRPNARSGEW